MVINFRLSYCTFLIHCFLLCSGTRCDGILRHAGKPCVDSRPREAAMRAWPSKQSGSLPTLLLTYILAPSSLFLFLLYFYQTVSFSNSPTNLSPKLTDEDREPRNLGHWLHPEEHHHRESTTIQFDWVVTKGYRYPDGVGKWVYLVNGMFSFWWSSPRLCSWCLKSLEGSSTNSRRPIPWSSH